MSNQDWMYNIDSSNASNPWKVNNNYYGDYWDSTTTTTPNRDWTGGPHKEVWSEMIERETEKQRQEQARQIAEFMEVIRRQQEQQAQDAANRPVPQPYAPPIQTPAAEPNVTPGFVEKRKINL